MYGKTAQEQINILENVTIQILQGTVKNMKESRKKSKYSKDAKNTGENLQKH